ncbi:MAG: hypothetical protein LUO93_03935 [Methanomicrobiales archaeon]|nr:hypothetical protein [Methanomicrobiales archaeon]
MIEDINSQTDQRGFVFDVVFMKGENPLSHGYISPVMQRRRHRICRYCGIETEEEYTDKEWEAAGGECEECSLAEFVDGTIEE